MQNEIAERFDSERDNLQGVQVPIPLLILLNYMIYKLYDNKWLYDARSLQCYFSRQILKLQCLCNSAADVMI